jgi:hypothetical protein
MIKIVLLRKFWPLPVDMRHSSGVNSFHIERLNLDAQYETVKFSRVSDVSAILRFAAQTAILRNSRHVQAKANHPASDPARRPLEQNR